MKTMKTIEIIKVLATTQSYATTRAWIPDNVIELIKNNMGSHYELFREKEELYQEMLTEAGSEKEHMIQFLKELSKCNE